MEQQITELKQEIVDLREQIVQLTTAVNSLVGTTHRSKVRLDEHIDFVEQTYTTLRSPLDFIRRRFDGWNNTQALPPPPNQN